MRPWSSVLLMPCLLLPAVGCNGWVQSYSPEYLSDVELATGELQGAQKRGVYCGCNMDLDYGETQFHCDPKDIPAEGELYFYAPLLDTHHLRARTRIDLQVGFPEEPWASSGFGVAYVEHARGDNLPVDPRSDIFSRVSFPYYITGLVVPEQVVASALDYGVSRTVFESRLQATVWCEDYQASIGNIVGYRATPAEARAREAWRQRRELVAELRTREGRPPVTAASTAAAAGGAR